jgi:hypothetical protein
VIAEWEAAGRRMSAANGVKTPDITINELLDRYMDFAELHYSRGDGSPSKELFDVKVLVRLKAKCEEEGKPWLKSQEKLKLTRQRASELMQASELPEEDVLGCQTLADVRQKIKLPEEEEMSPPAAGEDPPGTPTHDRPVTAF